MLMDFPHFVLIDVYPKDDQSDYDNIVKWINETYPMQETNAENIADMIFLSYDGDMVDEGREYYAVADNYTEDIKCYVSENGGIKEFDYYY